MAQIKLLFKRIIFTVIIISIIMTFCAAPSAYAKLTIQEGEYYYAGTQKGSYVPTEGIFSWLLNMLSELADFLLGIITMGIRMAFVGYTALVEQILTWALETTSGVNVSGESMDVSSSDWLSDLSNSSNNVTVQAIVYNMVPALNPNFFDTDYEKLYLKTVTEINEETGEKTEKEVFVSPTGLELKCKKCGKPVLECCTGWTEGSEEVKCYAPSAGEGKVDCGCNGCESCEKYALLKTSADPIIIQLKTLIAVWYYVIRLLAVAAMCIVLIFIGIKMAISTVASDRAVYKRMLVDWLVGIILIFSMHYIMYFAITINELLVDTVRNSANSINQVQLKELADTSKDEDTAERSNQDLEINIYEEIRSRAYDPKLTVGLSGMIMYITLVFMAVKYTLVYLKRFLTLAVLTLMAPGLGVSYAMQKALSGKSSSLKSWFSEYLLNLLIQVVHALIYAVFISSALALSLQNISGIILALILMNFSLSAEKIFRKIFNLDPGNKGLLGATETAGDKDKMQKNFKTMKGLAMGAKPVANALMFPGKAVVGTGLRAAEAGGLMLGATIKDAVVNRPRKIEAGIGDTGNRPTSQEESESEAKPEGAPVQGGKPESGKPQEPEVVARKKGDEDKELIAKGEAVLMSELAEAEDKFKKDPTNEKKRIEVLDKNRRLKRYREVLGRDAYDVSTRHVVAGRISSAFDIDNYFDFKFDENGNIVQSVPKKGLVFGTLQYNSAKGKFEVNRSNRVGKSMSERLGFTDKDREIFKQNVVAPSLQSIGGMFSMFMGMGNLVAHPLEGMTALTIGYGATSNMLRKFKRPKKGAPGRFKFNRFTTPTVRHISDKVVRQANSELASSLNKSVKLRHPSLWQNIRSGNVIPKTIVPTALGIAGVAGATTFGLGAPLVGVGAGIVLRRAASGGMHRGKSKYKNEYDPYSIDSELSELNPYPNGSTAYDVIDMHHYKQIQDQIKAFEEESITLISEAEVRDAAITLERNDMKIDKALDEDKALQDEALVQYWLRRGYEYDIRTGRTTRIQEVQESDINPEFEVEHKVIGTDNRPHIKRERLSQSQIQNIDKKLDQVIASKLNGEELDVNSEQMMDEIIKDLSIELHRDGILERNQSASTIFIHGNRLKTIIKDKAETANGIVRTEIAKNLELNSDELNAVEQAVSEVAKESADSKGTVDLSQLDQAKVLAKVQEKLGGQPAASEDERNGRRDVSSTVDALEQGANEERYKGAISAILSEGPQEKVINVDDKDMLSSVLASQSGVDILQIRSRISSTDKSLSRSAVSEVAGKVDASSEFKEVKKKRKKQISEVLEKASQAESTVVDADGNPETDSKGKEVKEALSSEEKLKQAKEALKMLDIDESSTIGATAINSLLAITGMQDNLEGLNIHAERTLSANSKFKKKPKQSYINALYELSEARQQSYEAELEAIHKPESERESAKKKIDAMDRKVQGAQKKIASVGPVKDVKSATKDVLKALKQGN